ncbi:NAD(P)/FAD-dependent oxidoreductase [Labrys okinawensis]|uniref:NAD(P)/FAD-dependent oxidoreductase n=1 Tax=Labrys okinawensis TaxID=346911 RepID=UPI0039BCB935
MVRQGEKTQADRTVVVGGGIVGLSCALALQRQGEPVLLLDPARSPPPASHGNAGHIAIEQVEPLASVATLRSLPRRLMAFGGPVSLPPTEIGRWLPFGLRMIAAARPERFAAGKKALSALLAEAMPAWRRLAASLEPHGLLKESGHAVVWHGQEAAVAGLRAWQRTDTGTARFHAASKEELAWLARVLKTPPAGGILFENTGQVVDPAAVLAALGSAFQAAGGERRTSLVQALELADGAAVLVLTGGERIRQRRVVVAAGVDSGALVAPLGLKAPIIAERGYHIQSTDHGWPDDLPPIMFEERSLIVSRFRSGVRASSFVEFTRRDAPADERKWQRLEAHAAALGLPARGPWQHWLGSRPTLPDYLPAIGRAGASNLFYAFGHQHLGLTLGPVTGELVAAMIAGGESAVPLAPFDLGRFG